MNRLKIPYRGFHHARHTAATEMLRRGVQIKVVSSILGHANIETTLRVYSHWIPDDLSKAATIMEQFGK
ncbi:MAG: tyrosine-type recombinase/integrase [Planctomycetaceae bacterium]|nr:tyrosine-type recombinase/integrase [Planctomycetaceae bacterium]